MRVSSVRLHGVFFGAGVELVGTGGGGVGMESEVAFGAGLQGGKRLTAEGHGVCLSSGQAGDALAGTNFPGVKTLHRAG